MLQLVFNKKLSDDPQESSNLGYLEEMYQRSYIETSDKSSYSISSDDRSEAGSMLSSSTGDYSTSGSGCPSPVFEKVATTVTIEHLVEAKPESNDFSLTSNSYCNFHKPISSLNVCKKEDQHCEPDQLDVDHTLGSLSHWDANGSEYNETEEWLDVLSSLFTSHQSDETDLFGIQYYSYPFKRSNSAAAFTLG